MPAGRLGGGVALALAVGSSGCHSMRVVKLPSGQPPPAIVEAIALIKTGDRVRLGLSDGSRKTITVRSVRRGRRDRGD